MNTSDPLSIELTPLSSITAKILSFYLPAVISSEVEVLGGVHRLGTIFPGVEGMQINVGKAVINITLQCPWPRWILVFRKHHFVGKFRNELRGKCKNKTVDEDRDFGYGLQHSVPGTNILRTDSVSPSILTQKIDGIYANFHDDVQKCK